MSGTLGAGAESVVDAATDSADTAVAADSAVVDSIRRLFNPESIAVVGASDQHGTPGHQLVFHSRSPTCTREKSMSP